jgi:hypothetical protein
VIPLHLQTLPTSLELQRSMPHELDTEIDRIPPPPLFQMTILPFHGTIPVTPGTYILNNIVLIKAVRNKTPDGTDIQHL